MELEGKSIDISLHLPWLYFWTATLRSLNIRKMLSKTN